MAEDTTDNKLFGDIEDEEERRKERKEALEVMNESPDDSFEEVDDAEENSCHGESSSTIPDVRTGVERTFCCKKHRALFMQSQNSIR